MRAWLCVASVLLFAVPANAADEFAASFRLRGGYDSNSLLAPSGKGSALIAWEAGLAYGREQAGWIAGVTAEASLTRYQKQEFEPVQNYRLRLRVANDSLHGVSLDATTTLAHVSGYYTRSEIFNQRVHLQPAAGELRPFVAGDLRAGSLNELNVLLGEFLPAPMRYLRGTLTPGIVYAKDKREAGASVALSRTRYQEEPDLFGFRRDNDRVQPSLYTKYTGDKLSVSGAISFLRVHSEEEFFSDVNTFLFDFSLAAKSEGWSGNVSLSRTAEDTTFPVSPLTINTTFQAKIARELGNKTSAGIFGRVLQREYWDTPLHARTRIAGIELLYDLADDVRIAGELGYAQSLLISGAEAEGVIATLALTKRFSASDRK